MTGRTDDEGFGDDPVEAGPGSPGADLLGDDAEFDPENLQTSTGGGMGPESYPPDEDENHGGTGANRGPS